MPTTLSLTYSSIFLGTMDQGMVELAVIYNFCLDAWALPCFALVNGVWRCCTELFHAFSLDFSYGRVTHTTGRLARTVVQGNCLFKVMGQETCQYMRNFLCLRIHVRSAGWRRLLYIAIKTCDFDFTSRWYESLRFWVFPNVWLPELVEILFELKINVDKK